MLKFLCALLALADFTAYAAPILNEDQQFELLQSIDNICGDTWCEGDTNWSFDAIACDTKAGCTLNLTMKPYDFSDDIRLADRPLSCALPDFTHLSDIVEITQSGLQYTPELFEAVGDCIYDLTDAFGPMYVPLEQACSTLFGDEVSTAHANEVTVDEEEEGLDAALHALTSLVRQRSKTDPNCSLETRPDYRDRASCERTKAEEICRVPTVKGTFEMRRNLRGTSFRIHYITVKK
jgi:hypothetical protein